MFAAFVGGAIAGAYAPVRSDRARTMHAIAAWAVASLIVIGAAGTATSGSAALLGNMAGPSSILGTRIAAVPQQQTPLTTGQVEQIRKAFAATMFAGFVGLIAGALAAAAGGWWSRELADEMGIPTGASRAGASTR